MRDTMSWQQKAKSHDGSDIKTDEQSIHRGINLVYHYSLKGA